jgi:hypothetical protein
MVLEGKQTRPCNLGDPPSRHKPSERRARSFTDLWAGLELTALKSDQYRGPVAFGHEHPQRGWRARWLALLAMR